MESIRDQLLDTIDRSGMSDRALSLAATGNADTVRNIRNMRSRSPKANTIEALCKVMGITLTLGSPTPGPVIGNTPPVSDEGRKGSVRIQRLAAVAAALRAPDADPRSDLPRLVLADATLATLVREIAEVWPDLPVEDRAWLRSSIELVRSRARAAPDRPAGDGG